MAKRLTQAQMDAHREADLVLAATYVAEQRKFEQDADLAMQGRYDRNTARREASASGNYVYEGSFADLIHEVDNDLDWGRSCDTVSQILGYSVCKRKAEVGGCDPTQPSGSMTQILAGLYAMHTTRHYGYADAVSENIVHYVDEKTGAWKTVVKDKVLEREIVKRASISAGNRGEDISQEIALAICECVAEAKRQGVSLADVRMTISVDMAYTKSNAHSTRRVEKDWVGYALAKGGNAYVDMSKSLREGEAFNQSFVTADGTLVEGRLEYASYLFAQNVFSTFVPSDDEVTEGNELLKRIGLSKAETKVATAMMQLSGVNNLEAVGYKAVATYLYGKASASQTAKVKVEVKRVKAKVRKYLESVGYTFLDDGVNRPVIIHPTKQA